MKLDSKRFWVVRQVSLRGLGAGSGAGGERKKTRINTIPYKGLSCTERGLRSKKVACLTSTKFLLCVSLQYPSYC